MCKHNLIKLNLGVVLSMLTILLYDHTASALSTTPSISISTPARIDLELVPSGVGAGDDGGSGGNNTSNVSNNNNISIPITTSNVIIKTTDSNGFRVLLSSKSSSLTKTSGEDNSQGSIASITKHTVVKDLPVNSWGIYFGEVVPSQNSTFMPIPTTTMEVTKNQLEDASGTYQLGLAARADTSLPAGYYSSELIISVVANPKEIKSLSDMTYMQDMTAEICSASSEHEATQLIDNRDGNTYWITKLKDGRCWMSQNLALTFGNPGVNPSYINKLTPEDSNVSTNWSYTEGSGVKMRDTEFTVPSPVSSPSQTDTRSWNLGKWVLATPLLTASCGDVSSIATCTRVGFVNVADSTKFSPGYTATTGKWEGANATASTLVTVNCTEWSGSGTSKVCAAGTYDEHYLIGNYYQFNTATAGSGGSITNADAPDSICPKGWQLPTAGPQANNTPGSFYYMLNKYGLTNSISAGSYNVATSPLWFVRGGGIYLLNKLDEGGAVMKNTLQLAGLWSVYWVSATYPNIDYAYAPLFANASSYPSNTGNRYLGFPLRCINSL